MALEGSISQYEIDDIHRISRPLYAIVEKIIGSERIVELRRQKFDELDFNHNIDPSYSFVRLIRGSRGEGYEFESSDIDIMIFNKGVIVLNEATSESIWRTFEYHTIFRTEYSSPGFVLVKFVRSFDVSKLQMFYSFVRRNTNYYIGSNSYREIWRQLVNSDKFGPHGPCLTTSTYCVDYDFSLCLYSPFWPEQAMSFVSRSIHTGWPRQQVLKDICNEGCLLVPISSKVYTNRESTDLEWRISFSLAEKRIMKSLNHCQFLTYGLLKLVYKEIFLQKIEMRDFVSSYTIKNVFFWEISNDPYGWTIENFLMKFMRVCYRLIIYLRNEYCPNFFVTERDMLLGRICSLRRQKEAVMLLEHFCQKGVYLLLYSPSIGPNLRPVLNHSTALQDLQAEQQGGFELEIDKCHLRYVLMFQSAPFRNINAAVRGLQNVVVKAINQPERNVTTKLKINDILQQIATFCFSNYVSNRMLYRDQRIAMNILKKAQTFYCLNHILIIKHLYKSQQYEDTIRLITNLGIDLSGVMYEWDMRHDILLTERQSGSSYESIIKRRMLSYVRLTNEDTIEELKLECSERRVSVVDPGISVPPLVFLNFLLLLSYNELQDRTNRNRSLRKMYSLTINLTGNHIHRTHGAISWEILGICQQLCGQRNKAFLSYINALLDENNDFKEATNLRLKSL
ncbi:hypothetical protein FSP39_023494 [Pinctada imbricata]|uniref:Uncharacterized protein n=1 Tax=Pinctada imbricata TaxID=66713 RepID=A0AA89BP96_PINIB|nr:hypothetical protein FSP39_023494 [Pinctada imbricata]